MSMCNITTKPQTLRIIEVDTAQEVVETIEALDSTPTVLFDVDDTLITPRSVLFRSKSPYRTLLDDIKKARSSMSNADTIIGNWRLKRKTMLVSSAWPTFISDLKKTHRVYALTKVDTGTVGPIASMEEWRYQELSEHGIFFSSLNNKQAPQQLLESAALYHGIFMTGKHTKGEVFKELAALEKPTQVVFIDDRKAQVEDIMATCQALSIGCLGIVYQEVSSLSGEPNNSVAELQKNRLLKQAEWLEDEEAEEILQNT